MDKTYIKTDSVQSMCKKYADAFVICEEIENECNNDIVRLNNDTQYQFWFGVKTGMKEMLKTIGISIHFDYITRCIEERRNKR